ncbi:MAG: hypothetical protein ACREKK_00450 [Candidatus Methylomirabilales bacterium]
MFKWLRYLAVIPQLVGLVRGVLELTRTAEELLAGGARGDAKRAMALDLLDVAVKLGEALGIPEVQGLDRQKLREAAGVTVDAVVAVLNATGVFKHSPPPT